MRTPRVRIGCMAALRLSGVLAALAAAGAIAAASWAGDAPTTRFLDPVGDNGRAADITAVAVSYHADALVFEISIADRATLRPADSVLVVLDSDDDRSSGGGGLDYAAALGGNGDVRFFRWDGQRLADAPAPAGLEGGYGSGVAHIAIPRSSVGSPVRFGFAVGTPWVDGNEVELDFAPASGYWSYSLIGQLQSLATSFVHRPRMLELERGSVRVGTSTGLSLKPDSVVCRAQAESRRLPPARACAWRIPAWAKQQPIRVSITVRVSGRRRTFVRLIQAPTPETYRKGEEL